MFQPLLALGALGALGGALAYRAVLRDPVLHWGARPDEVRRRLPGDELLEDADLVSTRAVTVDAPPSAIWPWLIQMGPGRAGAYTYDWVENLFGLDMHSSDVIVPEWQSMLVGDAWRLGKDQNLRAVVVETERALVVRSDDGRWVWAFVLVPEGEVTRLISRNRITVEGGVLPHLASTYLMEPGSLVMERKMLAGIRTRAERLARAGRRDEPAPPPTPAAESEGGPVAGPVV